MISPQSLEVSKKIYKASKNSGIYDSVEIPGYKEPPIEPVKLDVWLQTCREYLDKENMISEQTAKYIIDRIVNNAKLKLHLPPGKKCCITVMPFSNYGFQLEQKDIDEENYVKIFLIDENDLLEPGMYEKKSKVFKNLPVEIQKELTFVAGNYENEGTYDITDGDRQRIKAELERVFKRAMEIYNSNKKAAGPAPHLN